MRKAPAVVVRIDGASRGNPGHAGAGALVEVEGLDVPVERFEYLGETTNNVAEYRALLLGLDEAALHRPASLTVYSDSELLVRQLSGAYKVKAPALLPLFREASRRLAAFPGATVLHVPRERNREADALANRAIDERFRGR